MMQYFRLTATPEVPLSHRCRSQPLLWEEALAGGAHWSGVLRRGASLRLTALEGGANVAAMLYNYECLLERYNMADTLKAQHTAYLTAGCVCYSDMGRVLVFDYAPTAAAGTTRSAAFGCTHGQRTNMVNALPGAAQRLFQERP